MASHRLEVWSVQCGNRIEKLATTNTANAKQRRQRDLAQIQLWRVETPHASGSPASLSQIAHVFTISHMRGSVTARWKYGNRQTSLIPRAAIYRARHTQM